MDERRQLYWFFGILVAFKVFTLILIFAMMTTWSTLLFLLATHVLWISIALVLVWGPAVFWVRLMRVRAKRKRLQASEWNIEEIESKLR